MIEGLIKVEKGLVEEIFGDCQLFNIFKVKQMKFPFYFLEEVG